MKIVPDKQIYFICIFIFIACIFGAALILYETGSIIAFFIILCISLLICSLWLVAFGRHFEIYDDGIIVTFFYYKKVIPWEQITLLCITDTRDCFGYKTPRSEGIEIAFRPLSRPHWLDPGTYCLFRRPFSYVFISFKETVIQPKEGSYPMYYAENKEKLLSVIQQYHNSTE